MNEHDTQCESEGCGNIRVPGEANCHECMSRFVALQVALQSPAAKRPRPSVASTTPPTLGRIVHYTERVSMPSGPMIRALAAAIVGLEDNDVVHLHVWYPDIDLFSKSPVKLRRNVSKTDAEPGTEEAISCWNWPPRI